MKTKFTLLLALAVSASANAEKPNFNGFKPTASAPAPHSAPSFSGGGSSHSFNAGQAIGIARSIMPLVMNATQPPPRWVPPPPPRPSTAKRSSNPVLTTHKPATRNVPKSGAVTRNPSSGSRGFVPNPVSGIDPKVAAGLEAGRQIANGLQSLDSLRASLGVVQEFGNVFHQPGNAGPGSNSAPSDPFGGSKVSNPLDRFSNDKPRDIRGDMSKSRRGDGETGLSATGDRVLHDEASTASGRSGTTTPVESTTHPNGDVTASTTATSPDGSSTDVSVTEHADGSGTTTQTQGSDGRTDTVTITRRDNTGAVLWSRSDSVNLATGKQEIITRDGSGHTTEHVVRPGRRGCDVNPSEGAALGGSSGPGVAEATGLMPIDLVRQFAEGKPSTGFVPMINRHSGAAQVRPDNSENSRVIPAARPKPAVMTGQGLEGGHGGSGPDY